MIACNRGIHHYPMSVSEVLPCTDTDAADFSQYSNPGICFSERGHPDNVSTPILSGAARPLWIHRRASLGASKQSKESHQRETLMLRITCDTCGVVRNPG